MSPAEAVARSSVRIRPIENADGTLIEQYASDALIAATSHVPHPYPRGGGAVFASKAIAAWRAGDERTFAVITDEGFSGLVSLMAVNRLLARAQVGYWIAVPRWGRGIATEAVRLLTIAAFEDFRLRELGAGCLAENLASVRVLEKVGFAEGTPVVYQGADTRFRGRTLRTFRLLRTG